MSDIRAVEILVFSERGPDREGRSKKLRLVQWVVDGQAKSVKLESRNFYKDIHGHTMNGKVDGLTLQDIEVLHPRWKEMIAFMKSPPPIPSVQTEQKKTEVSAPPETEEKQESMF